MKKIAKKPRKKVAGKPVAPVVVPVEKPVILVVNDNQIAFMIRGSSVVENQRIILSAERIVGAKDMARYLINICQILSERVETYDMRPVTVAFKSYLELLFSKWFARDLLDLAAELNKCVNMPLINKDGLEVELFKRTNLAVFKHILVSSREVNILLKPHLVTEVIMKNDIDLTRLADSAGHGMDRAHLRNLLLFYAEALHETQQNPQVAGWQCLKCLLTKIIRGILDKSFNLDSPRQETAEIIFKSLSSSDLATFLYEPEIFDFLSSTMRSEILGDEYWLDWLDGILKGQCHNSGLGPILFKLFCLADNTVVANWRWLFQPHIWRFISADWKQETLGGGTLKDQVIKELKSSLNPYRQWLSLAWSAPPELHELMRKKLRCYTDKPSRYLRNILVAAYWASKYGS